jgi:hypothetical protein
MRDFHCDPDLTAYPSLGSIDRRLLHCRRVLLDAFSAVIPRLLGLSHIFTSCRAAIPPAVKVSRMNDLLPAHLVTSRRWGTANVTFNRYAANAFAKDKAAPHAKSLLSQLVDQLADRGIASLNRTRVPWHVSLVGEGALDAGGPGRELFAEVCMEVMHPALDLFIQIDSLSPNPEGAESLFVYVGGLIGVAYTRKLPQPFSFAGIELFPNGATVVVSPERKEEFVRRATKLRLKELKPALNAIRRRFSEIFPADAAALLLPWELELMVCCPVETPVEELNKLCEIEKGEHPKMLWKVLAHFTSDERRRFIKFASGRTALPPPGRTWDSKLQITFGGSPMRLPTAQTCSSQITIPKYPNETIMAAKLRQAISFTGTIEIDGNGASLSTIARFT